MTRGGHVVVIGETLIDETVTADGHRQATPGGSPMNVAVGLARLGVSSTLLSNVGNDARGEAIRTHVSTSGVNLVSPQQAAPTSVATARLDASGSASYEFDLNWDIGSVLHELDAAISRADAVHTGSIATQLDPGWRDVLERFRAARSTTLTSFDPNCRPSISPDVDQSRVRVEELVHESVIVKASREDVDWLYPRQDPDLVARDWLASGPAMVTITDGGDGARSYLADGRTFRTAGVPVAVIDTVGAGDSFMAALLWGLGQQDSLGKGGHARILAADDSSIAAILGHAARAAAITCGRRGAAPPTLLDLEATPPVTVDGTAR
jgi:fructokinase